MGFSGERADVTTDAAFVVDDSGIDFLCQSVC